MEDALICASAAHQCHTAAGSHIHRIGGSVTREATPRTYSSAGSHHSPKTGRPKWATALREAFSHILESQRRAGATLCVTIHISSRALGSLSEVHIVDVAECSPLLLQLAPGPEQARSETCTSETGVGCAVGYPPGLALPSLRTQGRPGSQQIHVSAARFDGGHTNMLGFVVGR